MNQLSDTPALSSFVRFFASTSLAFAMTTVGAKATDTTLYGENTINESRSVLAGDALILENAPEPAPLEPSSLLIGSGAGKSGSLSISGGDVRVRMTRASQNDIYVGHQGGAGTINMTGGEIS